MSRPVFCAVITCLLLPGCASQMQETPISDKAIAAVITEVKTEVGDYRSTSAWLKAHPDQDTALTGLPVDTNGHLHPACGDGSLSFDITSVKMDLTTTGDNTSNVEISATIPLGGPVPVGTLTPDVSSSTEKSTTQKLSFTVYPIPAADQIPVPSWSSEPAHGPIADTLLRLRKNLIQASIVGPCFDFVKPGTKGAGQPRNQFMQQDDISRNTDINEIRGGVGKGKAPLIPDTPAAAAVPPVADQPTKSASASNTFSIGITVTNIDGGKLKLSLAVVSVSGGDQAKSVSGNTITVTFAPPPNGNPVFLQ